MSRKNKKEVQGFYDTALSWSQYSLNAMKIRLNLTDTVQLCKANVIDDIIFIKSTGY